MRELLEPRLPKLGDARSEQLTTRQNCTDEDIRKAKIILARLMERASLRQQQQQQQ